jgi:hypothetical protein
MCFGKCPAYTLTITAERVVEFTPTGTYGIRGDRTMPMLPLKGVVTDDQLIFLIAEFEKIKFHSLRNHYGHAGKSSSGPSCPRYWTDSPSARITLVKNGKRKSVSHYLGCQGAKILADLEALEDNIDKTASTEKWISQFGWGGGASVIDLKLQVNPGKSSKPDHP